MTRNNEDGKSPSKSFITGAVALAFLLIGYQTAVFIHRAATLKILSSSQDTVYVAVRPAGSDCPSTSSVSSAGVSAGSLVSRSGYVSGTEGDAVPGTDGNYRRKAEVKERFSEPRYENFRFNPNTASIGELRRLGFSLKQAEAIDNYRSKGGRFRRKSDFAKSYVVEDSVFRRLEPYIDIPLIDLNTADSTMFETLPGIGAYFASKMVEHRKKLGGYSYPEQLMDIYHFDREKYDALRDLVEIATPPKPFALWTLPLDSLKAHPYIRTYTAAKAIILFRENNPASALTVSNLAEAGILDSESASKLERCVLSHP